MLVTTDKQDFFLKITIDFFVNQHWLKFKQSLSSLV